MSLFQRIGDWVGKLVGRNTESDTPVLPADNASTAPRDVVNDAVGYGVAIVPATVSPGAWYWQAVRVHHLTPEENNGNHHIFLDVLDPATAPNPGSPGGRVFGARARISWAGGEQIVTLGRYQFADVEMASVRCAGARPFRCGACVGPRHWDAHRPSR